MSSFLQHISGNIKQLLIWAGIILFAAGCASPDDGKTPRETPTFGTIHISVDESFQPVIDSEIKVFESSFPDVKIIPHYKSEADCFRDLSGDSTRMIIVTRGLSKPEEKFYQDSFHFVPMSGNLAYDAIAVIVNNSSKDSIFTMKDIRSLADGTDKKHQAVMDGVSETSTVRYVIDSILQGKPLGGQVSAARSSEKVIDYVAGHPDAIGFIGVGWIGNQDDPGQLSFLKQVNIASLQCVSCLGETYVKPYQANIALKRYPLVRGLYYILKEPFKGVGNNFVNFLQYERGQLIFKRAYLWPSKMSFQVRNMQITN